MTLRPCLVCGTPSPGARCAAHDTDNERRNAKTVRHGVKRAHFQKLRLRRLELAGGLCELQLRGCTRVATSVHLDERLAGNHDAATIDDVLAACAHCHGVKDGGRARDSLPRPAAAAREAVFA